MNYEKVNKCQTLFSCLLLVDAIQLPGMANGKNMRAKAEISKTLLTTPRKFSKYIFSVLAGQQWLLNVFCLLFWVWVTRNSDKSLSPDVDFIN